MDLPTAGAEAPAPEEAPTTPPPSLTLSGDQTSAIPDHTLGAEGTLLVKYCVRSASQPSDGEPGDKTISLDLTDVQPQDDAGGEGGGEAPGEGDEPAEDAEANASDSEGDEPPSGDADAEEKVLGFKRSKKKSPVKASAAGLGDY